MLAYRSELDQRIETAMKAVTVRLEGIHELADHLPTTDSTRCRRALQKWADGAVEEFRDAVLPWPHSGPLTGRRAEQYAKPVHTGPTSEAFRVG